MAHVSHAGLSSRVVASIRAAPLAALGTGPTGYVLPNEVDEEELLAASNFPIKPPELIERAKKVMGEYQVGLADESCLADNFEFCAPFVGPLTKEPYLNALRNFKIEDAFPDNNPRYHGFRVDPFQPNRVWFNIRVVATHTGETQIFGKPSGKKLEFPPQSYSVIFNEAGLVTELTVGYPIDRRVGNTGGLGGAFGYMYGVGRPLPIPECQPYKRSLRFRLLNLIGRVLQR
jgi:hypothetical protein